MAPPAPSLAIAGDLVSFAVENQGLFARLLGEHLAIVLRAIVIAVPVGITLGTVITLNDRLATAVLWFVGILLTIPSLALFGLLIPYLGIGKPPVVFALILYSQLPVVRNTYVGLTGVDESSVRAGKGLGMTRAQRLWRVQLPQALPVIMAGVRNAVVLVVGIAAIGAYIGAGGLGDPIFDGISNANVVKIVVTTVVLAGLTLAIDYAFGVVEQLLRIRNGEGIDRATGTRGVLAVRRSLAGVVGTLGGAARETRTDEVKP